MFVTCSIVDCEKKIKEWMESDEDTLYCGFVDVKTENEDYYEYGNYKRDFIEMIEEVQMNIRGPDYPENIVLSFKNLDKQPDDERLPVWNMKEIDDWGYWYLIGKKF